VKKSRRHFTGEEKVAILRRHLVDKEGVSGICEEVGVQPSLFYRWLKQLFENGAQSLERSSGKGSASRSQESLRVEKLEAKLREKNESWHSLGSVGG
jgi:transposase-like protein